MNCPVCGSAEARQVSERYHYTQCGLDWVYLEGVEQVECVICNDTYVTIPEEERLLEAIAFDILASMRAMHRKEIRFLRSLVGWTQEQMARAMGVTRISVAKWELGDHNFSYHKDLIFRLVWLREHLRQRQEDGCGKLSNDLMVSLSEHIQLLGDTVDVMKKSPGPDLVSVDVRTRVVTKATPPRTQPVA